MVSAVKCVSLTIHRPVPLGQIIRYMLIKVINKILKSKKNTVTELFDHHPILEHFYHPK